MKTVRMTFNVSFLHSFPSTICYGVSRLSHYILFILLFSLFTSCITRNERRKELPSELIQAESLMSEYPDSAYHILQNIQSLKIEDSYPHATWALLMTQVKYKLYIRQNDSLIALAYDYFIHHDDIQRKAMASYYRAAIYNEMNETEKAQASYLQAVKYVGLTNDYVLGYLINIGLGDLYAYRNLSEYALEAYEKTLYYAELTDNPLYLINAYGRMARIYSCLSDYKTSIAFYRKSIDEAIKRHEYQIESTMWLELSGCYRMQDDYENELDVAKKGMSILEQHHLNIDRFAYFCLGHPSFHLKKDSAEYYLLRALGHSIYTDMAIYQDLASFYQSESRYEEACAFYSKQCLAMDSIHNLDKHKTLIEMRQKYEQDALIKENRHLSEKKSLLAQRYMFVFILLLCILLALALAYRSRQIKLRLKEERINDLTNLLAYHTEMQSKMEEYSQSLIEQARSSSIQLAEINKGLDRQRKREIFLLNQLICNDEILVTFMKADHFVGEEEWKTVRKKIDLIFNNFTARLLNEIPTLTIHDLNICCMIKLYVTNKEAADILGISAMSVAKHKQRIKDKILGVIGSWGKSKSLDDWLREL